MNAQLAGAVEYTDRISVVGKPPPSTSASDMTAQLTGTVEYTDRISAVGKPPASTSVSDMTDSPNECSVFDTKPSDGKASVTLEIWGIRNTRSLPSLPGSLWPGMVDPDRVLSMGQMTYV